MLNSISRLGETRPEQEWSNGTEFSGYSDFPEKRVHSKRIPKFSKTFPGIFTVPFSFGPEISEFLAEWKAPLLKLINCSCHCYPTKTPHSGQVDEFRNPMKTERLETITNPCVKCFLICIFIEQDQHMNMNNFI